MSQGPSSSATTVQGLDVGYAQGSIRWNQVVEAGKVFAFIKATEGITLVDSQFQANWEGAKAAGLLCGAYHFYRPGDDPHQQANHFLSVVQPADGELPPVLDVETPGEPSEIIAGIQAWLDTVEQAFGKVPILYTYPSFWAGLGVSSFGHFPLWIANYEVLSPTIPEGWNSWTFWQYSESGSVPGIETPVDLDLFQGTLQDLLALTKS